MSISSSRLVAPPQSERSHSVSESAGQSHWTGPGIFVRVEVGVSFSPTRSRRLSFEYASRNMDDNVRNHQHPDSLMPGNGNRNGNGSGSGNAGADTAQRQLQDERPPRTRRRRIRSRSALQLRTSSISPESVTLSPQQYNQGEYIPFHQEPVFQQSPVSTPDHRPSQVSPASQWISPTSPNSYQPHHSRSYPPPQTPQASSSRMPPFAAVRQSTIDRKPLPPLPSRFRLGSDDLPWTSPTIIHSEVETFAEPSVLSPSEGSEPSTRVEDPRRTRELEQLHQAMMGIDSVALGNAWWEPAGSWDRQGDLGGLPRGPRSIGWAVAVPTREEERVSRGQVEEGGGSRGADDQLSPPPAYNQGQWGWDWEWEERYGYWVRGLRRSSSVR